MIVTKAFNMAKAMKIPVLGIVENYSYLVCPDCGKHSIRPSTLEERAAFFRRQIEFAQEHPTG